MMLCEKNETIICNPASDYSLFFGEKYKQIKPTSLLEHQPSDDEKVVPPTLACARNDFFT